MRENGRHFAIVAVLIAVVGVAAYYLLTVVYPLPLAASEQADSIDTVFKAHFIAIAGLFSLIAVFMGYSFVAFRRRPGEEDAVGAHFHGRTDIEIIWTIVPLGIVIAFGVWGAFVLGDITASRDDEMVVEVQGRQWSWVFSYPDYEDVGQIDELVLPVDQPILLQMNSDDVLHSFWVPEFRVKQDLVPGKTTKLRITPTEVGEYKVLCAEICGFGHADMRASVRVLSEPDFQSWLSERAFSLVDASPVERGQRWAAQFGCVGCHSVDGSQMNGPTWFEVVGREETLNDGTTVIADEAYLIESILNPAEKIVAGYENVAMPLNYEAQFLAEETRILEQESFEIDIVDDLIAYLETLSE